MWLFYHILTSWTIERLRTYAVISALFQICACPTIKTELPFDLSTTSYILAHGSFFSSARQTGTGDVVHTMGMVAAAFIEAVSLPLASFSDM